MGRTKSCHVLLVVGLMLLTMSCIDAQRKLPIPTLTVTTVLEKPYLFLKNETNEQYVGNDRYAGFIKDLLDLISSRINFQYTFAVREDGAFGTLENSSWSGMIGDLVQGSADLAAGPLTMTAKRNMVVNFGAHFQTFGRVAVVKQWPMPPAKSKGLALGVRLGRLFAPLDDSVWLLSGMAWFVSSLVLYIICRINPYEWRRMVKNREATLREGESFNCVNTYWFMLGAIFWQGFMRSPRSMGARIVVTFWWLYALIFVSMYISSLTNYLQSDPNQSDRVIENYSPIRSLQDILDDKNIDLGALKGAATVSFLKTSQVVTYYKLWQRLENDNMFASSIEDGLEKVRQSTREKPFVFFAESTMAEYFIRQPPCDLYMIRDFSWTGSYSFAFPISSDLESPMDSALLEIKESGTLDRLEKIWFTGECKGTFKEIPALGPKLVQYPPFQKVDLASFSGALILLIIGLAAGSLVTLVEFFLFKYTEENHGTVENKRLMKESSDMPKDKQELSANSGQPMTDV